MGMNEKILWYIVIMLGMLLLSQCKAGRKMATSAVLEKEPVLVWEKDCVALDTIESFLLSKAEAIMTYDDERYEVTLTLYSRKDSILYLSAVNSGYEIIRASVDHDTIRVIDRLNKVFYRTPLHRQFGYQFPVNFDDLQRISCIYYLCETRGAGYQDDRSVYELEFDQPLVKKRIQLKKNEMQMDIFEFNHQKTGKYLMGERIEGGFKIYANLMIGYFEVEAKGGTLEFNRDIKVKMGVNPRRYTYIDLQ
jgi:hypothetical protein